MGVTLNPYLHFRDNAKSAMEFYRDVFGGELNIMKFAEGGMPHDPAEADRVMHGQLDADNGITLMGADTPGTMDHTPGGNISVSLSGDDVDTLRGYWDKLSDGGNVQMPLEQAPWGDYFGQCVDKFGITWLVNISGQAQ